MTYIIKSTFQENHLRYNVEHKSEGNKLKISTVNLVKDNGVHKGIVV